MKHRINIFLIAGVIMFGGYIGYCGSQPQTVIANAPPIIRVEAPKETNPLTSINIDLNKETVAVEGTTNVNVNIQKEETKPIIREVIKYRTKWKTKPIDNRPAPFMVNYLKPSNKIPIPALTN